MERLRLPVLVTTVTLAMLWLLSSTARASTLVQAEPTPSPEVSGVFVPGSTGDDGPSTLDCRECHWDIYLIWEESAHGKGLSCSQCHLAINEEDNHARSGHGAQGGSQECMACHTTGYDPDTDTWSEGDIHCTVCHNPISPNHPDEPIPTDRSAELCGQCHIQANFEWQISTHGKANVSCVDCHNQHRTSLKNPTDSIALQCATCHQTLEAGFERSIHAEQGITCAECHLTPLDNESLAGGNARLNHSFEVKITACLKCHTDMLHAAKNNPEENAYANSEYPDAMASAVHVEVSETPPAANPITFQTFAAAFGIGAGMSGFSWVLNLIRRGRKRK